MQHRMPTLLSSLAIGITLAGAALVLIGSEAKARPAEAVPMAMQSVQDPPNPKIQVIFDQASAESNLDKTGPAKFTSEIREHLAKGEIRNGADFALASAIMAKGKSAQDALLSHDLAVCALALGYTEAKALVATSQDLLLARLGQKQRFGTQSADGKLKPVESDVSDSMRFIMGVPSLRESKRLVAQGLPNVPSIKNMAVLKRVPVAIAAATTAVAQ